MKGPGGRAARRHATGADLGANLRLHATWVLGISLCVFAGWFELRRALDGRTIAWVYAIEWPLFAVFGTYIWWRLIHREPTAGRLSDSQDARIMPDDWVSSPAEQSAKMAGVEDEQLIAWQTYLAALQSRDPPGGPPERRVG